MQRTVRAHIDAPIGRVHDVVADLATYPSWLDIVVAAEEVGPGPVWDVELRGRLGRFARSKRLRMARVEHSPPRVVVFARAEGDGRRHAPWELRVDLAADGDATVLRAGLHYGGALWEPVLARLLDAAVATATPRLAALAR